MLALHLWRSIPAQPRLSDEANLYARGPYKRYARRSVSLAEAVRMADSQDSDFKPNEFSRSGTARPRCQMITATLEDETDVNALPKRHKHYHRSYTVYSTASGVCLRSGARET